MNIRVLYNIFLVRLGIRQILPSDYINGIRVIENNDPMVPLLVDESLIKIDGNNFIGRKGMIERLLKAAKDISEKGYCMHVYQIYRSSEIQANRRKELYEQLKRSHPDYEENGILRMVNKAVASVGGGHQTGGAVDLGLCDNEGRELDMGTQYREHTPKTVTKCKLLNEEQLKNRTVLLEAMRNAGFVNYPAEWWHFCYGDKMWAAYSRKKPAFYDIVKFGT